MRRGLAVVILLAALVNLPLVHSTVTRADVERRGVLVAVTIGIDLLLLVVVVLAFRYAPPGQLEAVALGTVERCPPGGAVDQLDDERWEVRGEVVELAPDRVVLDAGPRRVAVRLDGHANPVGHQQPARVVVRLLGR